MIIAFIVFVLLFRKGVFMRLKNVILKYFIKLGYFFIIRNDIFSLQNFSRNQKFIGTFLNKIGLSNK